MRAIPVSAALVPLLLLAACGGDEGPAKLDSDSLRASCEAIDSLESYRYHIRVQQPPPAATPGPSVPPEASPSPEAPLLSFQDRFQELLSDYEIRGSYVAPDRTQLVMEFHDAEAVELRAIGGRLWERYGDTWSENEMPSIDIGALRPRLLCDYVASEISGELRDISGERQRLNGVAANHYTLGRTRLTLPEVFATTTQSRLPAEFEVQMWLAEDGDWPVKLDVSGKHVDEQGDPLNVSVLLELDDVNDENIRVEEPPAPSPGS